MLLDSPADLTAEERLQQALFIDLLRLAPAGAALYITPDSWDKLPALLGSRLQVVVDQHYHDWVVVLTPESRAFLAHQALQNELHLKFVHFTLKAKEHDLFVSYDRMVVLELDASFPAYEQLVKTYASILML